MPIKKDLSVVREMRNSWADINEEALPETERAIFLKRKQAVDLYIDGVALKVIEKQTGLRSSEVIRFTNKCSTQDQDGQQWGYRALIPNRYCAERHGHLKKLFMEYPELETFVLGNYFGDKKYTLERHMNVRTLHKKFLCKCQEIGIQNYEYPFTTNSKGYTALNNYINEKKKERINLAIRREGKDAQQKFNSTGFGTSTSLIPINPYSLVQIDGHKIDMLYTVEVEDIHGEIRYMPATRMWVIAVIDVATRAILGYSVTAEENYNQYDILRAIYNSIAPHKRINFKRPLEYPEGGGFPNECCPSLEWATFDTIMLDNAKSHLAENTVNKLTNQLMCTMDFGSVATPESRGIVERFFKTMEDQCFHRLPGTTGSNVRDVIRHDPEKESVKYKITYDDIIELLEVFIATYNNTPHSSLENQSPLQVLKSKVEDAGLKPYVLAPLERKKAKKLRYMTVERTVKGNYQTGSNPRIYYENANYHAKDMQLDMSLIGKKVCIEVDPDDISSVEMYDENGIHIATMVAAGDWGRIKHSLKTRKMSMQRSNANKNENRFEKDPLTDFTDALKKNASKSRRDATRLANTKREQENKEDVTTKQEADSNTEQRKKAINSGYSDAFLKELKNTSIEELFKRGGFKNGET